MKTKNGKKEMRNFKKQGKCTFLAYFVRDAVEREIKVEWSIQLIFFFFH